jgi:hypothetical protein
MNRTTIVALILGGILIALVWKATRNALWSFLSMVIVLFGAGVALLYFKIPILDETFAHSLGHALVIAAILAITVDVYLKERVLREVSSDVSKYLIGYRLPEEVQDRIRALLQTRWIRRNCTIRFRLTELVAKPGFVKIDLVVSKDLENITTEEEAYQDTYEYEKHLSEKILEMRCDSSDTRATYRIEGEALTKEKRDEPGVMQASGKKVKIPPAHESLGRYYRFSTRYESEYPNNYSDIVSFDQPTIGVIFEAECPIEFRVSAPAADVFTHNRWEYRRLFLPGEHIRFRWERIPGETEKPGDE